MSGHKFQIVGDENAKPRSFAAHLFAPIKIDLNQFIDLLIPFRHPPHIRRHAASVTISRVQLMAALFAVLVPLCSVLDWFVLPWPQWAQMTGLRFASAAVFVLLAWPWETNRTRLHADSMLMVLLLVPPIFYLVSISIIDTSQMNHFSILVAKLYALLPNIVLAGLAIFPLTAFEVLIFSAPAFFFAIIGVIMTGEPWSLEIHGSQLWLMVLVMGVAMFSGMSQLHYMAALVNRAMIDPLTQVYTRRSGGESLDLMFRLSDLQDAPLSVVFFDLDHFKSINDTYGHDEGDKALITLAEQLKSGLRKGDVLARWGGEEFIAILPNTDLAGAKIVISRLHQAGFGNRPDGTPLTASMGAAERIQDQIGDWPHLVELADQRMYQAKKTGRNRAVLGNDDALIFGQNQSDPTQPAAKALEPV